MLVAQENSDSTKCFDLFGEGKDSVIIKKSSWGLYEIGHVKAFSHRDTVSRTFMLGTLPDSLWKAALYLLDQGRPVTFAGNTLVKGIAYLPEAGPSRGAVDGKDFNRKKLVEGDIRKSKNLLPPLDQECIKYIVSLVSFKSMPGDFSVKILKTDSLIASFDKPTLRIHCAGSPIFLSRIVLKGNIIVSSDTLIEVSSSVQLQNIILTAPKIIFKDDFKGSVQAFATDTLISGESSHFYYPSAFALMEIDSIDNKPKLIIAKKSRLDGVALLYVSFLDRSLATMTIAQEAVVNGQVYADGLINHEGRISGTLVCNKFLLTRPSGTYENYLLDCTIDRSSLSSYFLGSPMFSKSRKNIAKWLD